MLKERLCLLNHRIVKEPIKESLKMASGYFRNLLLGEQWDLRNIYQHIQTTEE